MQKNMKNEKGAISLFVLLSILFFLAVVTGVVVNLTNREARINSQYEKLKENYEKNIGNEEQVYIEALKNKKAIFEIGNNINKKMKQLAGTASAGTSTENTNIKAIKRAKSILSQYETANNQVSTTDSEAPIYMWFDNGTIYFYSQSDKIYMNPNSSSTFSNLRGLTDINGLSEVDTTSVIQMNNMFQNAILLEDLSPLSNWNTGNTTKMNFMFGADSAVGNSMKISDLTPLTNWDVSKVTNMNQMFKGVKSTTLSPLRNWNVSHVTNMGQMFARCSNITSLDGLRNWNISSVTDAMGMFHWCTSLASLEGLARWNTSNITNMRLMFCECASLVSLDGLANWNTSNVTNMELMFHDNTRLQDAYGISRWNVENVDNFNDMFGSGDQDPSGKKYSELQVLDIKDWNMKKAKTYNVFLSRLNYVSSEFTIRSTEISSYNGMLNGVANKGGKVIINYTRNTESVVDAMLLTKESDCNVVKGVLVE